VRNGLIYKGTTVIGESRFERRRVKFWVKVLSEDREVIPGSIKQLLSLVNPRPNPRVQLMRRYSGPVATLVTVQETLTDKFHSPHYSGVGHHKHVGVSHCVSVWVTGEGSCHCWRRYRGTTRSILSFCL